MDASEGITIRVATPDDAEALTHLHLDCWDDAYTGLIPQEVLDRRRVGYALLLAAVGDRPACLWVLKGNDRAIRFYERQGFRLDAAVRDGPEGQHLRMVRRPRTTSDG